MNVQDMLTLNQAILMTKRFAKWSAIVIGTLITLFILFRITVFIKNIVAPTPPAPPTVLFGKLPPIVFPQNTDLKKYNYTLDTVTGTFPKFSDRAKVFKIVQESPDLLALQKASKNAKEAGFPLGPVKIKDNIYQWTDPSSIGRRLNMDIFSSQFSITSSYLVDPNVISGNNLPTPEDAKNTAQSFLSNISLLANDLDNDKTKVHFFSIQNLKLIPTTSVSNAQIIEVDFFQKDIDKLLIYYPSSSNSTMSIFVGGGQNTAQIVKGEFFHQSVSKDSSTYPIKTGEQAFSELKDGNAYIESPGKNDVLIQDIFLAYYMSDKKQDYLMPIIVFKGDNGFVAYLSAVTDGLINK